MSSDCINLCSKKQRNLEVHIFLIAQMKVNEMMMKKLALTLGKGHLAQKPIKYLMCKQQFLFCTKFKWQCFYDNCALQFYIWKYQTQVCYYFVLTHCSWEPPSVGDVGCFAITLPVHKASIWFWEVQLQSLAKGWLFHNGLWQKYWLLNFPGNEGSSNFRGEKSPWHEQVLFMKTGGRKGKCQFW